MQPSFLGGIRWVGRGEKEAKGEEDRGKRTRKACTNSPGRPRRRTCRGHRGGSGLLSWLFSHVSAVSSRRVEARWGEGRERTALPPRLGVVEAEIGHFVEVAVLAEVEAGRGAGGESGGRGSGGQGESGGAQSRRDGEEGELHFGWWVRG